MDRPRLTQKVVEGILAATGNVLAGPQEGECEGDWEVIQLADLWARRVRDWMRFRKTWRERE